MDVKELRSLRQELAKRGYSEEVISEYLIQYLMDNDEVFKTGKIWPGYECPHCGNDLIDTLVPPENSDPANPAHCNNCGRDYYIRLG